MAHERLTLLDIAKMNNSDEVAGLIDEAASAHPEWTTGFARTITGTHYETLVRTGLPAAGFRDANEGIEVKKSVRENRIVQCFIVDAGWDCDTAVADAFEDGPEAACALEAGDHMEAATVSVCSQFYYGTASSADGAAKGYAGLIDMVDSGMVVDATGTSAGTGSSVWGIKFGPKHVAWVFGKDGRLDEGEIVKTRVADADGNYYWAYAQMLQGFVGVQVGNKYALGRIKDCTADSGKTLTDDLISDLLSLFPVGSKPDVLAMSRRSLKQLQQSRTATNATGTPAPFPQDSFGVPIMVTDSILDTETLT